MAVFERLAAVFFPPRCVICQDIVAYGELLCKKCGGLKRGGGDVAEKLSLSGAKGAVASAAYNRDISKALFAFKQYADKRMTVFFAGIVLASMRGAWANMEFDLITSVPMNAKRLRQRGFNQAERLASEISSELNIPARHDLLVRSDKSMTQHELDRDERMENARRSYTAADNCAKAVTGKIILLVDDVITTGATASVCASILLDSGAREVWFAAVATSDPD